MLFVLFVEFSETFKVPSRDTLKVSLNININKIHSACIIARHTPDCQVNLRLKIRLFDHQRRITTPMRKPLVICIERVSAGETSPRIKKFLVKNFCTLINEVISFLILSH